MRKILYIGILFFLYSSTRAQTVGIPNLFPDVPVQKNNYDSLIALNQYAYVPRHWLDSVLAPKMTNPMNATGDMIVGGASGAPTRVAIGANKTIWTSNGTTPGWALPDTTQPFNKLLNNVITGSNIFSGTAIFQANTQLLSAQLGTTSAVNQVWQATDLLGHGQWATPAAAGAGGSNSQLQYNNSGSFGGLPLTWTSGTSILAYANTVPSGLAIGNTYTTTANNQTASVVNGTITLRGTTGDTASSFLINPSFSLGANTQTTDAVIIKPAITTNGFTGSVSNALELYGNLVFGGGNLYNVGSLASPAATVYTNNILTGLIRIISTNLPITNNSGGNIAQEYGSTGDWIFQPGSGTIQADSLSSAMTWVSGTKGITPSSMTRSQWFTMMAGTGTSTPTNGLMAYVNNQNKILFHGSGTGTNVLLDSLTASIGFIQNQNAGAQTSSNFNISGGGTAGSFTASNYVGSGTMTFNTGGMAGTTTGTGSNVSGQITWVAPTVTGAGGSIAIMNPSINFTSSTPKVVLTAVNTAAASQPVYIGGATNSSFTVSIPLSTITSGTTFIWNYVISQ